MADKQHTVCDAIEDTCWASHGVRTGSAFNHLLVTQRELAQMQDGRTGPVASVGGSSALSELLFPCVDKLFELIPGVIRWIEAGLACVAALAYALFVGNGRPRQMAFVVTMWSLGLIQRENQEPETGRMPGGMAVHRLRPALQRRGRLSTVPYNKAA